MFYHEAEKHLSEGTACGRLGWPKGDHVVRSEGFELEVTKEDSKNWELKTGATVSVPEGVLVYISGGCKKAEIGYQLTHDDKYCSDWYIIK